MANQLSDGNPSEIDVGGDRQDGLFDALSDPQRRFALQYLRRTDAPVSVDELVTELVAWEVGRPVTERTSVDRGAVEIALVHKHLPKLAEIGFVSYDAETGFVVLADRTDEVRAHLEVMTTD
ncbi:DUF7344 domain-containing protein [Halomicrobium salinisoli]|uniref:DUF7344 domain-containing protein n=1 Tax=Halomicrobium salinisoli TaxID=2878391 RepID=UPI001CF0992F|nr:hypothetical protein [Halomicrobium salinisoli]